MVRRVASSVAVLSVVVLGACSEAGPPPGPAGPGGPPAVEESPAALPLNEPIEGTLCAEFPPREAMFPAGRLEGWWNATPADPRTGAALADPAEWEDARMREHPRVAVVDTQSGSWSTWDRTNCGEALEYAAVVGPDWPSLSYAIVDIDSGELLDSVDLAEVGEGNHLTTTASLMASMLVNGGAVLDADAAEPYSDLARPRDPFGLVLESAAGLEEAEIIGGTYESPSGVGFSFRVHRGEDMFLGEPLGFATEPLEVDGGEGWTFGGPSWSFTADAVTADAECSVSVAAQPTGTDVPPWPEGYAEYLSTTVLSRLLATC